MLRDLGVSFAPTHDNAERSGDIARAEGIPAAIQMLALRMPKVRGARSPIPAPLLDSQGMGGMGQAAQQIFQTLQRILGNTSQLELSGGGGLSPMSASGGFPAPQVIPGATQPLPVEAGAPQAPTPRFEVENPTGPLMARPSQRGMRRV